LNAVSGQIKISSTREYQAASAHSHRVQVLAAFALETNHMSPSEAQAKGDRRRAGNRRRQFLTALVAASILAALTTGCGQKQEESGASKPAAPNQPNRTAVIETDVGTIKFELLESEVPRTAENFRLLAERGYYNGTIFHRIISGFMIQGGDPNGDGSGGQTATGAMLPNEINKSSSLYQGGYRRGLVAMANKGRPETGSSQFFIMHQTYPLPPVYTIFGRVIDGMDVVDKIASAPTTIGSDGQKSRPVTPVKMNKVYVQ
jgi:cyclophilin family peptidyl-prolyl cis-trans isomerase